MRRILVGLGLFASLAVVLFGASRTADRRPSVPDRASSAPTDRPVTLPEGDGEPEILWEGVDLDAVRAALPDNRYWTDGLPTSDPEVKAERARAAEERNRVLGNILSGNATDGEITTYYDDQQQLNEDYVAFSRLVLERYRGAMTERDIGLLELARTMNEKRLAQLPDERLRAFVRKNEQERARAAWNDLHRPGG